MIVTPGRCKHVGENISLVTSLSCLIECCLAITCQPNSAEVKSPPDLLISTVCSVNDLDSLWIGYRYMMRSNPHQWSMSCMELDTCRWHILSPYHGESPDASNTGQPWSRNTAESTAVSDEENIKAE